MNLEEIKQAINENSDLRKDVANLMSGTEEGKNLMNTWSNAKVKEAVQSRDSEIYGQIDSIIKEVTGSEKPHGMKTSDHISSLLEGLKDVESLKAKIEAQKGGNDERYNLLDQQLGQANATIKELNDQIEGHKSQALQAQKLSIINSEFAKLNISNDMPDEVIQAYKNDVFNSILKDSKIEDGQLVFVDAEGKFKFNESRALLTPAEVLNQKFSPILSTGKKKGLGSGQSGKRAKPANVALNGNFTNKIQVNQALQAEYKKQGLDIESDDFVNDYKHYTKDLGLGV